VFYVLGTHYEAYESMLSSFVQGLYTAPAVHDWNLDWHFFLFALYAKLNMYFPSLQIYGILFFLYNWICLCAAGMVLGNFLNLVMKGRKSTALFIMLYSILMIDNFINLSSTRTVFISMFTTFSWMEYCRITERKISVMRWILLGSIFIFLSLVRMDAVFLSGLLYSIFIIIHRRFYKGALLPLFTGLLFLVLYLAFVIPFASTARQAFYYNELDIIDRDNVNYEKLNAIQRLEVEALRSHSLFDEVHFSPLFYNSISAPAKNTSRLVNGMHLKYAYVTLINSLPFYATSSYFILLSLFPCVYLFNYFKHRKKWWLLHVFTCLFIPIFVCLYVITPTRFLVPYYAAAGLLNIILYLKYIGPDRKIYIFIGIVLIVELLFSGVTKYVYSVHDGNFHRFVKNVSGQQIKSRPGTPFVVYEVDMDNFFPVNPLEKINRQNILFLNFYYFNSYNCYIEGWQKFCHCNSLSLKKKVDYMVESGNLFLVSKESFLFMQRYFAEKYHLQLEKNDVGNMDDGLSVITLKYIHAN
jgi:hypothetical protein